MVDIMSITYLKLVKVYENQTELWDLYLLHVAYFN